MRKGTKATSRVPLTKFVQDPYLSFRSWQLDPCATLMVLTRLFRVVAFWQKAQVEFHGQYSLERLTRFIEYSKLVSWTRVVVFIIATPLPCLVAIVAFEIIELKPPEAGASANGGFWLRFYGVQWLPVLATTLHFHRVLGLPPLSFWFVSITTALANVLPTAFGYGLAHFIGFPVPFTFHLISPMWILGASVSTVIIFKPYLHQLSALKPKAIEFCKTTSVPGTSILVYPVYVYIFRHLHASYQGVFSLILPTSKIIQKNAMSHFFRLQTDLRPEEIVMNIEVFASLFATLSVQSSSILPMILLTGVDTVHACISLYDILSFASIIEQTRRKLCTLQSDHDMSISSTAKSIQNLLDELSVVMTKLDEASRQRIASAALHRAQYPTHIELTNQVPLTQALEPTTKRIAVKPQQMLSFSAFAVFPAVETKPIISHVSESPTVTSNQHESNIARQSEKLVLQLLRFLHATEYIVLVEFIKIVIPVIYTLYLSVAFRLPSHEFYPQLQGLSNQQQHELTTTIFTYAAIELAAFTMVSFVVWWRLHFSLLKQLAFVLDSQWRYVQLKFVVWVIYVIQSSLVHFGVDYSFRFKWLHQTSS